MLVYVFRVPARQRKYLHGDALVGVDQFLVNLVLTMLENAYSIAGMQESVPLVVKSAVKVKDGK